MAGVLPELRNTGGMEWDFYMQNFCHPIPAGSKPQVGDVGTVLETFEDGSTPLFHHGFIYISPSLVYSKNGEGKSEPYALQSLAPMAKTYGVTGYGGKCITDEGCPRGDLRYYRCETFDQYFARAQTQRRSELSQTVKHISQLECLNQKAMFDHSGYAEPLKGLIEDSLQTMVSYLQQNAQGWPSSTPDEKKLLRSLALRVESVQTAYRSDGGRDTGLSSLFSKARMELESH